MKPSRTVEPELTCGELRRRLRAIPQTLREMAKAGDPRLPGHLARIEHWEVTGIGASEGPARLLVTLLHELSIGAQFVPTVDFLQPRGTPARGLIAFSQGLSPNARIGLEHCRNYGAAVLFTAVAGPTPDQLDRAALAELLGPRDLVWPHPPAQEGGGLVRMLGPACASYASLRFVLALARLRSTVLPSWSGALERLPTTLEALLDRSVAPLGADPLAILTASLPTELARSLSWKWQEGLLVPLPPSFDVLSFAHGPVQSLHPHDGPFLFCKSGQQALDRELGQRLGQLLDPARHVLLELSPSLPGPAGWLELDVLVNQLMLAEIEDRGLDPSRWPLQGRDAPLYGIGQ